MIFQGRYENEAGIFRPYISAELLSPANEWIIVDFLVDTGVDETFLDFSFIKRFNIDTKKKIFSGKEVISSKHLSHTKLN